MVLSDAESREESFGVTFVENAGRNQKLYSKNWFSVYNRVRTLIFGGKIMFFWIFARTNAKIKNSWKTFLRAPNTFQMSYRSSSVLVWSRRKAWTYKKNKQTNKKTKKKNINPHNLLLNNILIFDLEWPTVIRLPTYPTLDTDVSRTRQTEITHNYT